MSSAESAATAAADESVSDVRGRVRAAPAWAVSLLVVSLSLWVGGTAFFSMGVLPVLFLSLEPSEAGRIAALLFPVYFRAGLVAGVLACASAFAVMRSSGRRWRAVFALLVCMTAAQAWSTVVVHPEMARIRGEEASIERFQQLHRLSVRLNGVVLAGGVILLCAGGLLLSPRRDQT